MNFYKITIAAVLAIYSFGQSQSMAMDRTFRSANNIHQSSSMEICTEILPKNNYDTGNPSMIFLSQQTQNNSSNTFRLITKTAKITAENSIPLYVWREKGIANYDHPIYANTGLSISKQDLKNADIGWQLTATGLQKANAFFTKTVHNLPLCFAQGDIEQIVAQSTKDPKTMPSAEQQKIQEQIATSKPHRGL